MPDAHNSSAIPDMSAHLKNLIRATGPITLEVYMDQVLTHPTLGYYTTQEPFGKSGDFITAPEVSQMFGELIGVWCTQTWKTMGSPQRVSLVEMGPGRGTLMKDLLRATSQSPTFANALEVHLVEVSARLRDIQNDVLGDASITWHDNLSTVPTDIPVILVSNELLDALPIRQFEHTIQGWCERLVDLSPTGHGFRFVLTKTPSLAAAMLPEEVRAAPLGSVAEVSPASVALIADISRRLQTQGGAALFIDYGSDTLDARNTIQSVAHHKSHPPLETPGKADLCAHVDFAMLAQTANQEGARVWGPVTQGAFLSALGIIERAAALRQRATDSQHKDIDSALNRLVGEVAMGSLFKVLGLSHSDLRPLEGFNV